jgi:hypothetical protein
MNPDKIIFDLIRAWLLKQIAGCECGGSGQKENPKNGRGFTYKWLPCPTCAPLRELVKELCWHEINITDEHKEGMRHRLFKWTCTCGEWAWGTKTAVEYTDFKCMEINPNLTTATEGSEWLLVTIMKRAGLLGEFFSWMDKIYYDLAGALAGDDFDLPSYVIDFFIEHERDEIISNARYLRDAVKGFMEGLSV